MSVVVAHKFNEDSCTVITAKDDSFNESAYEEDWARRCKGSLMIYRRRLGYAKLGRSLALDPEKFGMQGDAEAPQLLVRLAQRNPDVEFVLVGKYASKADTSWLPPNVTAPWTPDVPRAAWNSRGEKRYSCSFCKETIRELGTCCERSRLVRMDEEQVINVIAGLDGMIVHAGQHGNANSFIPPADKKWADNAPVRPYVWALNYAGYLLEGMNQLGEKTDGRAPVTWIVTDPRNYLKCRDLKWPSGTSDILAQHQFVRTMKHERYLDPRLPDQFGYDATLDRDGELWLARHTYRHAALELMILPDDWETWGPAGFDERQPLGIASTAAWMPNDQTRRSAVVRRYVLGSFPDTPVWGRWDKRSAEEIAPHPIGENTVAQFPALLGSWRATVSLPAVCPSNDGANWTVAKPYQCWAARTVCFMLGPVDQQGWMIPSRRRTPEAHEVAPGLYSVRDNWTEDDLHLARWLRVESPDELAQRVGAVTTSRETWEWVTNAQRDQLRRRWNDQLLERTIEWQQNLKV